MQKCTNGLSFKGKYALLGDKATVPNAVQHIKENKKNAEFYNISSGEKSLVIVATDNDAVVLRNKKQNPDFTLKIKEVFSSKGGFFQKTERLFNYIFNSSKDARIIMEPKLASINKKFSGFNCIDGSFWDKRSFKETFVDGTYRKYGASGVGIIEEKFKDGTIIKLCSAGARMYQKTLPTFSSDGKPITYNYLYDRDGSLTYIAESTGRIAKVDKDGNETWLDVDPNKTGVGFSEGFVDDEKIVFVRNYSDGSKDIFRQGVLREAVLTDGTNIKYNKTGGFKEITRPDGTYERYNIDGVIAFVERPDSTYEHYFEDGSISEAREKDGTIKSYYKKGTIKKLQRPDSTYEHYFKDGSISEVREKDGTIKGYYESGAIKSIFKKDGTYKYYYENGEVSEAKGKDGTIKGYYESGAIKSIFKKDGTYKYYYEDGKIKYERISDYSIKRYVYIEDEVFSYETGAMSPYTILSSDEGTTRFINEKEVITFVRKDGTNVTFDAKGCLISEEEEANRESFVDKAKKNGGIVDTKNNTVCFLRDNGDEEFYSFDGKLISRKNKDGYYFEFDTKGNTIITASPSGKIKLHISPRMMAETMSDEIKIEYNKYYDKFLVFTLPDGTKIKCDNVYCDPMMITLPDGTANNYCYESNTHRLLFVGNNKDNTIDTKDGEVDYEKQTVSFAKKDGSKNIYSFDGKLIGVRYKNGTTDLLDENGKLKEKVYPNKKRNIYDNGVLKSTIFPNGIIEEYDKYGIITKITDPNDDEYEYFLGRLIKLPRGILIKNKKQRELFLSARQSLISTIAWKLSPKTKECQSEHAKNDATLGEIFAKMDFNQKLSQALKFSRPVENDEPMEISEKENIKYLSYLKKSWNDISSEEFSLGLCAAYTIFKEYMENGIDSIEDYETRKALEEWIQENPDKNEILMRSKQ